MRTMAFATRNTKELLRDPLNLIFALGFPLVVLGLLSALQANIPNEIFPIETLAPGITVFGLSFISLFAGMLIAKDRSSAFLMRLYASPLSSSEFISGYILPLIPLSIAQIAICLAASLLFGLKVSINILLVVLILLPAAVLFIGIGLLCGSIFNDKQVGGLCGALLTNLCAWLSGTWFDLDLVGGPFKAVAYKLPFAHTVDAGKAALSGDYASIMPHMWWVIGYAAVILILSIWVFSKKMKNAQN